MITKWVIVYIAFALVFGIVFALFYPPAAGLCGVNAKGIAFSISAIVSAVIALFVIDIFRRYI